MTNPLSILAYKVMALVLSLMASWGMVATPSSEAPVIVDENAALSFAVWGDCQVSNYMYERQANFSAACADLKNTVGSLVLVGDIGENGMESEYSTVRDMLNPASNAFEHFLCLPGNHDIRLKAFNLQHKRFSEFNNSIKGSVPLKNDSYWYSYEINGYKFIITPTDKTVFEEAYISDEQLSFIDREIASTQGTGKPVFVFAHQPLKNTHGLPGTWNAPEFLKAGSIGKQSDRLKAVFEKYNNVVFITGHLHTGTGEYTYEDYGSFKAFNVQSICANNDNGLENDAQGLVFSVYPDKICVRSRIFGEGKYVDESVYRGGKL